MNKRLQRRQTYCSLRFKKLQLIEVLYEITLRAKTYKNKTLLNNCFKWRTHDRQGQDYELDLLSANVSTTLLPETAVCPFDKRVTTRIGSGVRRGEERRPQYRWRWWTSKTPWWLLGPDRRRSPVVSWGLMTPVCTSVTRRTVDQTRVQPTWVPELADDRHEYLNWDVYGCFCGPVHAQGSRVT